MLRKDLNMKSSQYNSKINSSMEYADSSINKSPYKILKMIDGSDILCKVLQEYSDALVVELPMSVTKHAVHDRANHLVEHTGLQRWINFTNDVKFVISKEQILGFGNLSPEVVVYYKMISGKAKEEAGLESANTPDEEALMSTIKDNIEKLQRIMEDNDEDDMEELATHETPKTLVH